MRVLQRFQCIKMSSSNAPKLEKAVDIGKVLTFLVADLSKECEVMVVYSGDNYLYFLLL